MPLLKRVNFNEILTFNRNTDKTGFVLQSDGFGNQVPTLKIFAPNEPAKVIVDPLTKERLGISIHGQRTNLLFWSEEFQRGEWVKNGSGTGSSPIVTTDQGIAPDGTMTADRVQFALNGGTTSSDISTLQQNITLPAAGANSRSLWMKSFDGQEYEVHFGTNTAPSTAARFTVTSEWKRFDLTQVSTTTTTNIYFGLRNAAGVSGVSDSADILIWGAQLEAGAFPTPYIKTEGTTVTRLADRCEVVDIDQSSWFNNASSTLVVEAESPSVSYLRRFIYIDGGTTANRVILQQLADNQIQLFVQKDSVSKPTINISGLAIGGKIKIAFTLEQDRISMSINGGVTVVNISEVPQNLTRLFVSFVSESLNGTIKSITYEPRAMTAEELQSASQLGA